MKVTIKKSNFSPKNIAINAYKQFIQGLPSWNDVKTVFAIVKKELLAYLYNPTTYIIAILFILVTFMFFNASFFLLQQATLSPLFDFMPWILLFVVPALCMNLYANERRDGTIEYLFTQPISNMQLITAKYLSVVILSFLIVMTTVPAAFVINLFGNLDWGIVFAQYSASLFLIICFSSIGTVLSLFFKNQIAVFLSSLLTSLIFILFGSGLLERSISTDSLGFLESISLFSHFIDISRGALETRNIIFLIIFVLISFTLTNTILTSIRYSEKSLQMQASRLSTILVVILSILISQIGGIIPGRIDLTANQLFSVSDSTVNILNALQEEVTITAYVSSDLPAQFQPTFRDVEYIINEYERLGNTVNSNIIFTSSQDEVNEAIEKGVQQIQFNTFAGNDVQIRNGFLGLVVQVGDDETNFEPIPFVEVTDTLEFQLTSIIYSLSNIEKPTVAFLDLATDPVLPSNTSFQVFRQELSNQFNVIDFNFGVNEEGDTSSLDPATIKTLIISNSTSPLGDEEINQIKNYFINGGTIVLLENSFTVSATQVGISATPKESNLLNLFEEFGVTINNNAVFDTQSSERAIVSQGFFQTQVNYPFWPIAFTTNATTFTENIETILIPWTSSISISNTLPEATSVTTILETSEFGELQQEPFNISIEADTVTPTSTDQAQTLPLMVELLVQNSEDSTSRAVIAGTNYLFDDQFIAYEQNLGFGIRIVEALSNQSTLSAIQIKSRSAPTLQITNENEVNLLRYGLPGISVGVVILFGGIVLWGRNRRMKKEFSL